jgi:hypothetical protein
LANGSVAAHFCAAYHTLNGIFRYRFTSWLLDWL